MGKSLDDTFKKVTAPAGVAVVLHKHWDFSRPFQQPHSPQKQQGAKHTAVTHEKPGSSTAREAASASNFIPASPRTLPALLPQTRAGKCATGIGEPAHADAARKSRDALAGPTPAAAHAPASAAPPHQLHSIPPAPNEKPRSGPGWAQIGPCSRRRESSRAAAQGASPPRRARPSAAVKPVWPLRRAPPPSPTLHSPRDARPRAKTSSWGALRTKSTPSVFDGRAPPPPPAPAAAAARGGTVEEAFC
nr:uncharacterized protein LOC127347747 [Lolium perenne]